MRTFMQMWKHPNAERSAIRRFQNRQIRRVVTHAYHYVPYYRRLFDVNGISPEAIHTVEDLHAIPVSSVQNYRILPESDLLSRRANPDTLFAYLTSGSTGRPFTVRRSPLEEHLINFFRIRVMQAYGHKPTMRHVRLVAHDHQFDSRLGYLRHLMGIYRRFCVNGLQSPDRVFERLIELRPHCIGGFPGVIARLATYTDRYGMRRFPSFITTGGEILTTSRRKAIERGFRCRVYDVYGAHEVNLLAWECPASGTYHVCDDNIVLEVLVDGRPAQPGEQGEVVVTALHSYSMPFIRYRIGDLATRGSGPCDCGQPFSTILSVDGRRHDYFEMPDNTLVHPEKLIVPIVDNAHAWLDQYQLVQVRRDLILLRINPNGKVGPEMLAQVKAYAMEHLHPDVQFEVELTDRLPFEPSGKFRYSKSLVNPSAGALGRVRY